MDSKVDNVPELEAPQPRTAIASVMQTDPERYEVTLPSGAKAQILKHAKGKHIRLASRMAANQKHKDDLATDFGLVAVKALYNGKPLTIEDVDELPQADVFELLMYVNEKKRASDGSAPDASAD